MSVEKRGLPVDEALEEAIRAYFADAQEGSILTGFTLTMTGVHPESEDGGRRMSTYSPEHQSLFESLGLVEYARNDLRNWQAGNGTEDI